MSSELPTPKSPAEQLALVQRDAITWHKILGVNREGDKLVVTVVRGLVGNDESSPQILATKLVATWSQALEDFLHSPAIQAKILSPTRRGIILVDVAGYSRFDTRGQAAILTSFNEALKHAAFGNDLYSPDPNIDQIVPTGDGCYLIYHERAATKVLQSVFTVHSSYHAHQQRILRSQGLKGRAELGLRFAAHVGEVDFIIDAAGNRNAFGSGLNDTARILQLGRQKLAQDPRSVVFFSDELDAQAAALHPFLRIPGPLSPVYVDLGEATAKHGRVFKLRCFTSLPTSVAFTIDSLKIPPRS